VARWHAREVTQVAFIVVLVASALVTGHQVDDLRASRAVLAGDVQQARAQTRTNAAAVESMESLLADVCDSARDAALEDDGLETECKLAEAGNIEERVPVVDPVTGPVAPAGPSADQIQHAVDGYLRRYLADLPGSYTDDLRSAVVDYLAEHPTVGEAGERGERGKPGRDAAPPKVAEIAAAVAAYLQANPPPPGQPGEPGAAGVGVAAAFLDGCDVVFTYTDGTTSRIGPICGPTGPQGEQGVQGEPGRAPTAEEVRAAVDAYCSERPSGDCVGPAGRGIADMECIDENPDDPASRWRITYTDGTVDENAGPCRGPAGPRGEPGEPGPPGEPAPSPTPTDTPTETPPVTPESPS
jgi:hypothetical protein